MSPKVWSNESSNFQEDCHNLEIMRVGLACDRIAHEFIATTRLERKPLKVIPDKLVEIGRLLGNGGFSEVCEVLAKQASSAEAEIWAVKRLHPTCLSSHESFWSGAIDLIIEAKILNALEHKHIIQLHGVSCDDASLRSCYEGNNQYSLYLDCLYGTVDEKFDEERRHYAPDHRKHNLLVRVETIALPVADAMKYLHSHNIIYRDLKPSNMGFDIHGELKLFDFGLAREIPTKSDRKLTGATGSRRYMSPEVALSQPYGLPADVYSFGVFLFECCTLVKPFDGMSRSELTRTVAHGGYRPSFRLDCATPKSIQRLVRQCWVQSPNARPNFARIVDLLRRELATQDVLDRKINLQPLRSIFRHPFACRNALTVREMKHAE